MKQPDPYPDLYLDRATILPTVWETLRTAAQDRRSTGHTPTAGTRGEDGAPRLRTVVLRACDAEARTLDFHTDIRAPKVRELQADPRMTLHFYLPDAKLQLRVRGQARIEHQSDTARQRWDGMSHSSQACYNVHPAPSTAIEQPRLEAPVAQGDAGLEHFAVVRLHIEDIDWLYLSARGHLRAQFTWDKQGQSHSHWVAP